MTPEQEREAILSRIDWIGHRCLDIDTRIHGRATGTFVSGPLYTSLYRERKTLGAERQRLQMRLGEVNRALRQRPNRKSTDAEFERSWESRIDEVFAEDSETP